MSESLSYLQLVPAMQQAGCPICRLRNEREKRYLDQLLLERVNDAETWNNIAESFGYCPKHTWEMGFLEIETYHDAVKNSMIYENLIKRTVARLVKYSQEERSRKRRITTWFPRLFHKHEKHSLAFELEPFGPVIKKGCMICRVGEDVERFFITHLLEGLCEEVADLRSDYRVSDGLCLLHFRQAFTLQDPILYSGIEFLVNATIKKLDTMGSELTGFIDKHSLGHREPFSERERTSWIRTLRFYGSNEENLLLDILLNIQEEKDASVGEELNSIR